MRLLALGLGLLGGCAVTPPILGANGEPAPFSVTSTEEVEINGTKHFFLIRGAREDLPVLLVVHGGLGTPYSAYAHTFQHEWEKRFIVVHVDQRGSGRLYCETARDRINAEQLLDDTRAIAQYLNDRFRRRIFVMGHSWGSYLALRTVAAHPELFEAYVGVGQNVGLLKDDLASHEWARTQAEQRGDAEALAALEKIGTPPYRATHEAYDVKYGLVAKYGGFLKLPEGNDYFAHALLHAPEYTFVDAIKYLDGMGYYEHALLQNDAERMWHFTVEDIGQLAVPAYFISGEFDHTTPVELVEAYAKTLNSPHTEFIRIADAAHFPFIEQQAAFTSVLFDRLLHAP